MLFRLSSIGKLGFHKIINVYWLELHKCLSINSELSIFMGGKCVSIKRILYLITWILLRENWNWFFIWLICDCCKISSRNQSHCFDNGRNDIVAISIALRPGVQFLNSPFRHSAILPFRLFRTSMRFDCIVLIPRVISFVNNPAEFLKELFQLIDKIKKDMNYLEENKSELITIIFHRIFIGIIS